MSANMRSAITGQRMNSRALRFHVWRYCTHGIKDIRTRFQVSFDDRRARLLQDLNVYSSFKLADNFLLTRKGWKTVLPPFSFRYCGTRKINTWFAVMRLRTWQWKVFLSRSLVLLWWIRLPATLQFWSSWTLKQRQRLCQNRDTGQDPEFFLSTAKCFLKDWEHNMCSVSLTGRRQCHGSECASSHTPVFVQEQGSNSGVHFSVTSSRLPSPSEFHHCMVFHLQPCSINEENLCPGYARQICVYVSTDRELTPICFQPLFGFHCTTLHTCWKIVIGKTTDFFVESHVGLVENKIQFGSQTMIVQMLEKLCVFVVLSDTGNFLFSRSCTSGCCSCGCLARNEICRSFAFSSAVDVVVSVDSFCHKQELYSLLEGLITWRNKLHNQCITQKICMHFSRPRNGPIYRNLKHKSANLASVAK